MCAHAQQALRTRVADFRVVFGPVFGLRAEVTNLLQTGVAFALYGLAATVLIGASLMEQGTSHA